MVGAGPAGAAAAITLAGAGRDVVLVDKARFPRDKCCGDGLTTLALRELEPLGFEPAGTASFRAVDGAWLRSPTGREVELALPRDGISAAVIPRVELDAALVGVAVRAGATVVEGASFAGPLLLESDGVTAAFTLDDGSTVPMTARHLVAADGAWSPIRRAAGLTPAGYRGEWHALRAYVDGVTGPASSRLYVWFDADLLPGYAWSFPLTDGRTNVGFGVLRAAGWSGRAIAAVWDGLLDRAHVRAALGPRAAVSGRMAAWPIPARIGSLPLSHGRVLFTGDAAAATDVLTGEGIGQALLTGRLAGEAIVSHASNEADLVGRAYARDVRRELLADHRMSAALGRVLAGRRGAAGALAIVDHSGAWGRRNFARWMFEDEPRAVLATPRRWHADLMRRAAPYSAVRDRSGTN